MPIDFTKPDFPQEQTPGTESLMDVHMDPVQVPSATGAAGPGYVPQPELPVTPNELPSENLSYTPDYWFYEGIAAGFQDTAVKALYNAFDAPDFEYDPTFNSTAALDAMKRRGMTFQDDDAKALMDTHSSAEFQHQFRRIQERDINTQIAGQELLGFLGGSLFDVDTLISGGLGAASKASKATRVGIAAASIPAVSGAAYAADTYSPLTTADIVFQVSLSTAAGVIPEALTKKKIVIPFRE